MVTLIKLNPYQEPSSAWFRRNPEAYYRGLNKYLYYFGGSLL